MNTESPGRQRMQAAFTLIELLVVIAIIGTLAAMLLPALSRTKISTQEKVAKSEEVSLIAAISQYKADYTIMPASTNAINGAATANTVFNDFTFGTFSNSTQFPPPSPQFSVATPGSYQGYEMYNSEVISILRNDGLLAGGTGLYAIPSQIYNPRNIKYFNPSKVTQSTTAPGIGSDDVFRDPWGSPYIVTLDMNGDGKCYDNIWGGKQGIMEASTPSVPGFYVPGDAMVWSFGHLRGIQLNAPVNTTTNKQLVASWR